MTGRSDISSFYKLAPEERLKRVQEFAGLTDEECRLLSSGQALSLSQANRMIENVVGLFQMPFGIATNFLINRRDYLIPMVIEEPSVVAAASHGAKMVRARGGFTATSTDPIMIGQIQVTDTTDPGRAMSIVLSEKQKLLARANEQDPVLVSLGGGAKDLEAKVIQTRVGRMVIVELLVDCRDVAGMNAVDTMVEGIAPAVEDLTGGRACLRIISNLATRRLARARCVVAKEMVGGDDVVEGIVKAQAFAESDIYRCTTHNKGIMNGIIAVVQATGNDHRAIEAGAHAYASRTGRYMPLTTWEKNNEGDLVGTIEIPMALGTVGGVTKSNPVFQIALKILGVKSSRELAEVVASVGLAQNLAALRALVSEGIQKGHMKLHARNVAVSAGATGELIDIVAGKMIEDGKIREDYARDLIREFSK
ncbi:hydroxymethylglutaryl-CoA reductase, degradative [Candidatus Bathyarchaeota archaeon]|nr:hydroxymethylglutaryl-CoA reductase, degradative [Candidatus Bathyarchaeota archaeon]